MIDLLLLKLRNCIADKEHITANANRENHLGGWQHDWNKQMAAVDLEITALIKEIESSERKEKNKWFSNAEEDMSPIVGKGISPTGQEGDGF